MRAIFVVGLIVALAAFALANPAPESKMARLDETLELYKGGLEELRKLGIPNDELVLLQADIPNPDEPFRTSTDVIKWFQSRTYLRKDSQDKLVDLYKKAMEFEANNN